MTKQITDSETNSILVSYFYKIYLESEQNGKM